MSAKLQIRLSDTLLPANEFSAEAEAPPVLRVVSETPASSAKLSPPALPAATSDPLRAIKAMSEEEKIALCS